MTAQAAVALHEALVTLPPSRLLRARVRRVGRRVAAAAGISWWRPTDRDLDFALR